MIEIKEYDPRWIADFKLIAERVRQALGDLAVEVQHVGSTAVPGLAAKPIIDIDAVVSSPVRVAEAIVRLESAGWQHQGDLGIAGREAFEARAGLPPHHLYICVARSRELGRHLKFRDRLRADAGPSRPVRRLEASTGGASRARSRRVYRGQARLHRGCLGGLSR